MKRAKAKRKRRNPVPPSSVKTERMKSMRAEGERLYEDFSGMKPETIVKVRKPDYDDVIVAFGECEGILYKTMRDGEVEHYIHRFRAKSRPLIAASSDGKQLYLLGGKYKFTDRGIVDK